MPDIHHLFGSDLSLSATGDVLTVEGPEMGRQRVIRRLLSNPATDDTAGDLLFAPDYGAGLPRRIGDTTAPEAIQAAVTRNVFAETAVAREPPPMVAVAPVFGGASIRIAYADAETGETVGAGFTVER